MEEWELSILDAWDKFEERYQGISTSDLLSMVEEETGRSVDDVSETLAKYRNYNY